MRKGIINNRKNKMESGKCEQKLTINKKEKERHTHTIFLSDFKVYGTEACTWYKEKEIRQEQKD